METEQGELLKDVYGKYFDDMIRLSTAPAVINEDDVYQKANVSLQKYMDLILDKYFLPASRLYNPENFKKFYEQVQSGKRALILMEHYSNLDLPALIYLLRKQGEEWAESFADNIVAVAGKKLNEDSAAVRVWSEGFSRVVIYPPRSLEHLSEEERLTEEKRAKRINLAAMRAMDECKRRGEVILVFPAGTRYRPGKSETKKGLSGVESYLRVFDIMLLVSINGNALRINPENPDDMMYDILMRDTVLLKASNVFDCAQFRKEVLHGRKDEEAKQAVVDKIMMKLEELHESVKATLK